MSTLSQTSENTLQPKVRGNSTDMSVKTLVLLAMLSTLAYWATFFSNFIPLKVAGFLEFDFKDVIIVMSGFLCGPVGAAMVTVVVSLIQFITISSTGLVGLVMNILATGSFSCIASLIYWYRPNFKGAVLGLSLGTIAMTILMLLWNYAITPMYMGVPRNVVVGMLLPVFLPFNLAKAGMNSGLVLLLYPNIMKALTKANLVKNPEEGREGSKKKAFLVALAILSAFVAMASLIVEVG